MQPKYVKMQTKAFCNRFGHRLINFIQVDRLRVTKKTKIASAPPISSPQPTQESPTTRTPECAVTTSSLSFSSPSINASINQPIATPTTHNRDMIMEQHVEVEEDLSDIPSICGSPSWDSPETRKRKKEKRDVREKRRKEVEKAESEAKTKHRQKLQKRSRPSTSEQRTEAPSILDQPKSATGKQSREVQEAKTTPKSRSRAGSGSVDIGARGFLNAAKIPGPWNFPDPIPQNKEQTSTTDGFVGGIKLQMAEDTTVQGEMQNSRSSHDNSHRTVNTSYLASKHARAASSPMQLQHIGLKRNLSTQQGQSIYDQSSSLVRTEKRSGVSSSASEVGRMVENTTKKGHRSSKSVSRNIQPLSDPYLQQKLDSEQPGPGSALPKPSGSKGGTDGPPPNSAKPSRPVSDRPPISYRGPYEDNNEPRGRSRRGSWIWGQKDKESSSSLEDEGLGYTATIVSTNSQPRGRSWSITRTFSRKDRSRNRSTARDSQDTFASNEDESRTSRPSSSHISTSRQIVDETNSSTTDDPKRKARSRAPSLKGLKITAKAVFSKAPETPPSRSATILDSREGGLSQYGSSTSQNNPESKAKQNLQAVNVSKSRVSSENRPGSSRDPASRHSRYPSDTRTELSATSSHVRPSTESSGDSIFAESTSPTTPTRSRPQSRKGSQGRPVKEFPNGLNLHPVNKEVIFASVIGGDEEDDVRSSEDGGVKPKDSKTVERDSKTSTTKEPKIQSPKLQQPSQSEQVLSSYRTKEEASRLLQRRRSQSGSASTPDIPSLSFLPELKHQPLTRPSKSKDKGKGKAVEARTPKSPRPPPPSSPLNPSRQIPAIPAIRRRSSPSSPPLNDPIAKFFVICCSCRYFHDMPSKVYECMTKPDDLVEDTALGVRGVVSSAVKCPWCGHGMGKGCCEGWVAVVEMRERLH
jgi:hypothetical protein